MTAPRPTTLAIDLRSLVPAATGIGVHTRELAIRLASRPGLRLIGMAHAPLADPAPLRDAGITIEVHPTFRGVAWQQLYLPQRLAGGDVDLFWSPLMTLPWRLPIPAVVTVHDLTTLLYPETHSLKVRATILPFLRRSVETARRVIAVSQSAADDLRFHFPQCADRIRVVPNGVEPAFRPAHPDAVASIRQRLGCPHGYVLYAGTLEPRKQVDLLVEAWASLRAEHPDLPPLLLAGGWGWGNRALLDRIAALAPHGVRHLGRVDHRELVELLQAARLFVYPSAYEGFGLPVLEAMACGVPVIATDSSSLPEVVGDAGLLVPPGQLETLALAISELLGNPGHAATLAARGLARAAGFTWEHAAERLAVVLDEALAPDTADADARRPA